MGVSFGGIKVVRAPEGEARKVWEQYLEKRGADKSKLNNLGFLGDGLDAEEEKELGIADKNKSEANVLRRGWDMNGAETKTITIEALQKRETDIKAYADYIKKISPEKLSDEDAMLKARELYASGTNFEARDLNADAEIKKQADAITVDGKVKLTEETGPLWGRVKVYVEAHKKIKPEQAAKYILWVTEALKYEPAVQAGIFSLETEAPEKPPAAKPAKKGPVKARKVGKGLKRGRAKAKPAEDSTPPPVTPAKKGTSTDSKLIVKALDNLIMEAKAQITAADKEKDKNKKLWFLRKADKTIREIRTHNSTSLTDEQKNEIRKITNKLTWKIPEAEGRTEDAKTAKDALGE